MTNKKLLFELRKELVKVKRMAEKYEERVKMRVQIDTLTGYSDISEYFRKVSQHFMVISY